MGVVPIVLPVPPPPLRSLTGGGGVCENGSAHSRGEVRGKYKLEVVELCSDVTGLLLPSGAYTWDPTEEFVEGGGSGKEERGGC